MQRALMLIWRLAVVADPPRFPALSVQVCTPDQVGGARTIQSSLGLFIATCAVFVTNGFHEFMAANISWLLLPGAAFGLISMRQPLSRKLGWNLPL